MLNLTFHLDPALAPFLWVGLAIWALAFCLALASIMSRSDFDPVTRLTWVIVLLFVPVLGIIIYAAVAVPHPRPPVRTDNQLAGTPWENNPHHTRSDRRDS